MAQCHNRSVLTLRCRGHAGVGKDEHRACDLRPLAPCVQKSRGPQHRRIALLASPAPMGRVI